MKKVLFVLLAFAMMLSFASCGKDNKPVSDGNSDSYNSDSYDEVPDNKIDFNISTPDLDLGVDTYDDVSENRIDFEIEPFEFDFKIEAYEVPENKMQFEIENFELNNIENFDVTDSAKIGSITEDAMKIIIEKKQNILYNLELAFRQAGISVNINKVSGEIALDSSVLFGGDSAELSAAGKEFLKKFITVYSTVVLNDEYDGFISKVLVEGHTAPTAGATYESDLPLSQQRADNVKNYCLSSETGISADNAAELQSVLEAAGLSNSKPVKDAAGTVDMDASRRVTFRFLINLD